MFYRGATKFHDTNVAQLSNIECRVPVYPLLPSTFIATPETGEVHSKKNSTQLLEENHNLLSNT